MYTCVVLPLRRINFIIITTYIIVTHSLFHCIRDAQNLTVPPVFPAQKQTAYTLFAS